MPTRTLVKKKKTYIHAQGSGVSLAVSSLLQVPKWWGKQIKKSSCVNHIGVGETFWHKKHFFRKWVWKWAVWGILSPLLASRSFSLFCYFTALLHLCLCGLTDSLAQAKVSLEYFFSNLDVTNMLCVFVFRFQRISLIQQQFFPGSGQTEM